MESTITEIFDTIIKESKSLTEAEEAFNFYMKEHEEVKDDYKEWCDAMGYTEKKGFSEYYKEYIEHLDSIWDSIYPNREEYDGYDFNKE